MKSSELSGLGSDQVAASWTQESAHLTKQSRQGYKAYSSPDVDNHEAISPCDKGQVMIHRFVICICEKDVFLQSMNVILVRCVQHIVKIVLIFTINSYHKS